MTKSKAHTPLFMRFTILAMALVAVSCVKAGKHQDIPSDPSDATNIRLKRSGESVDLRGYAPNMFNSSDVECSGNNVESTDAGLAKRREYNCKMCGIEDMRSRGNILGMKFKVYSELDLLKDEVEIRDSSCVYWTASVPYNYFGDAVNLGVNFIFRTTKEPKAYIHKKVLFNPWDGKRGDNPEFRDYTRTGITPHMRRLPWAHGPDEIDQAMRGSLVASPKRLEVTSIRINALDKEKFFADNTLGASLNADRAKERERVFQLRRGQSGDANNFVETLDLHMNIHLDGLKVRLRDSSNQIHDEELKAGRYRIYAQLLATDIGQAGKYYIISDRILVARDWNTTTMGVNAVLPLSLMIRPQWGNLSMAIKVIPLDLPDSVQPYEGLFHVGRFNEVGGSKSLMPTLSEYRLGADGRSYTFSYDDYLKKAKNHDQWEKGLADQQLDDVKVFEKGFRRFMFTTLNVLFSRIMPGDTATDRTIQYTVDTCLTDNLSGSRPGGGLEFEIEVEADSPGNKPMKIMRQTDDNGCLRWFGTISHKYYHRENLVKKASKLTFVGEKGVADARRPTYTLEYYINPWDEKFTFGRDIRALPPEYLEQINRQQKQAPPTRLLITNFDYTAIGFRYGVDKYMNLTVKKSVLLHVKPKILKYNSIIWGRSGTNDLRDGIYLLKVAMQKDYLDPAAPGRQVRYDVSTGRHYVEADERTLEKKQFLVIKETLVRVLGGEVVTPIEFEINDLRTLRIRSQMFIQLETIDEMLLRKIALIDDRLGSMTDRVDENQRTVEIMNILASEQEIQKRLEVAKAANDQAAAEKLMREKQLNEEKLKVLTGHLDGEKLRRALAKIDEIRRMGSANNAENTTLVQMNMKYQTLSKILQKIRDKVTNNRERTRTEDVQKRYRQSQAVECKKIQDRLVAEGRTDDAQKFRLGGEFCPDSIPQDQMFYHLVAREDIGSDEWLKSILSAEEYELFQSNSILDDFTKPYQPNYDFDLLSNQGDEKKNADAEPDQDISGLPRRTFIGPVTFLLNGNGSAMRPTDVLGENTCVRDFTCAQLENLETEAANNSPEIQATIRNFNLPVNSAYENSPYFGSVAHFYGKQVNDLIPVQKMLRQQYHHEMKALSHVGNMLARVNIDYVTMGAKQQQAKVLDHDCYLNWKERYDNKVREVTDGKASAEAVPFDENCLKPSPRHKTKQSFMQTLNGKTQDTGQFVSTQLLNTMRIPEISEADMKEFSKNALLSQRLSFETKISIMHRMCYMLRRQIVAPDAEGEKSLVDRVKANIGRFAIEYVALGPKLRHVKAAIDYFEKDCHNLVDVFAKDVKNDVGSNKDVATINSAMNRRARQLPMVFERRVRVLDTSNRYIYKDGKSLNYSVGANFSMSHSFGVSKGREFNPLKSLMALVGSVGPRTATGMGVLGGVMNFEWKEGEGLDQSDGTSVNDRTELAAQISTLDIELSSWEKCVVARFDEKYLLEGMKGINSYIQMQGSAGQTIYKPEEDLKGLGYMMCSGDVDSKDDLNPAKPLRIRERYYYFTQHFTEGDMQDPGSLVNYPWLLKIRGARDFALFIRAIKATPKNIGWGEMYTLAFGDLASLMRGAVKGQFGDARHNEPSSLQAANPEQSAQALEMMGEAFRKALPTFPGMYTFSDSEADVVTSWPGEENGSR